MATTRIRENVYVPRKKPVTVRDRNPNEMNLNLDKEKFKSMVEEE